jgi:tellurite resistance protein
MSWWAYSFPLAAFTIASQIMYLRTGSGLFSMLSYIMLAIVTGVVSILLFRTARAIISGNVFQPD